MRFKFAASVVACCLLGATVLGAPGDLIQNVNLPVTGFGVSVAVDCDGNVYYTLNGDNNLYVMDKDGNLLNTLDIGVDIDEMTWDESRGLLWGALHGSNPIDVYTITPAGVAAFAFTATQSVSAGSFRDGIAFDGAGGSGGGSLYITGDVSSTIEEYDADTFGFIRQFTPTDAAGGTLGIISGITVGLGDQLYLGRNGLVEIVRVTKSTGAFIDSFASPGGARDEGLECDAVNFAPLLALWSREFNSPGFMSVIEIEPGSCACAGEPGEIPTVSEWGLVVMVLLLLAGGKVYFGRRSSATAATG